MIAGLTGSIATGKSTVSGMLRQLGAVIVDADRIVRDLQRPGEPAWREIVEFFGEEILLPTRELDRAKLGGLVFGNEELRAALNGIVHPLVRMERDKQTEAAFQANPQAVVIWDVPLLIETGIYREVEKTIVVYVDAETQLERLLKRDELTREQAEQRMAAQMSIEDKRAYADYLIDNRGSLADTEEQVRTVWQQLCQLATERLSHRRPTDQRSTEAPPTERTE